MPEVTDPLPAPDADEVAAGLAEVVADVADELGGPPTLAEWLEIVGWSAPTRADTTDDGFPEPLRLTATLRGTKRHRPDGVSRVGELNDHVFEDARQHHHELARRLHAATGAAVSPQRFAAAVGQVLRTGRVPLADVAGGDVRAVAAELPRKRAAKPVPGDVLAIPAAGGGYRLAVVLTENRFGTALGLFERLSPNGRLDPAVRATARPQPVYTEDSLVRSGGWRVVGHDEGLRALFPADPPIYHRPGAWPGIDTGRFGAAETADGALRLVDEAEARAVGLLDGGYRQTYPAAYLQKVLDDQTGG